jgi:hypothetical protein
MEVLPEHMRSYPQSRNRRPRNAMTPDKKPSAIENSSTKFSRRAKNATSAVIGSPVTPTSEIFMYGDGLAHGSKM